jgi:hypothetical protein
MPRSKQVTTLLKEYAKTLNDKIIYDPTREEEYREEIKALDEKHEADFRGKGNAIRNVIMAKLDAEYLLKTQKLKASKPLLIAEFAKKRFESTDIDKYGVEGIRISLESITAKINTDQNTDEIVNKSNEDTVKNNEEHEADLEAENAAHKKEAQQAMNDHDPESKKQLLETYLGDTDSLAITIGEEKDGEVDLYEDKLIEDYEKLKKTIEENARAEGEAIGAEKVRQFNELVRDKARTALNTIENVKQQAAVKLETVKQAVKLKLAGVIGPIALRA